MIKSHIEIEQLPKEVPDYKNSGSSKEILTEQWLTNWIKNGLQSKKLYPNQLLPIKAKIAYYLGVSIGTVQNAIRYMEDKGIVESKQRIGTYIKTPDNNVSTPQKLTGKRDLTIKQISYYILDNDLQIGDKIPSIRAIAKMLSLSTNTVRLSVENLVTAGILKSNISGSESFYTVEKIPVLSLDNCIKMALENNPSIMSSIANARIYKTKIGQAWSGYFPKVGVGIGYTRNKFLPLFFTAKNIAE